MRDTDRQQRLYSSTKRVLAALIDRPSTVASLAEKLSLSKSAVEDAIKFWKSNELAYVSQFVRSARGPQTPIYSAGKGEDAEKLPGMTAAERAERWRKKGGDSHRARSLRVQAKRIEKVMSSPFSVAVVKR